MTEPLTEIGNPDPIAEPEASGGVTAGLPEPDRDDCNAYAAYWQARSGFFNPIPDPDHTRRGPDQE